MQELLANPYFVKALKSVIVVVIVFLLSRVAMLLTRKRGKRTSEAPFIIKYTGFFLFGVSMIIIWLEGIGPMLTALTIVAAALTIVSKEMILNFLGSFVIFWRELFAIGDRVQMNDHTGDVIDKGLFYFTLLESGSAASTGHSTGRLIKIPNSLVMTVPIINATRGSGYVWNEVKFLVTRKSDWEKGRERLLAIVEEYLESSRVDLERVKATFEQKNVYFTTLRPKVYIGVESGNILLTVRYICRSRLIRESEDYITVRFLRCHEEGIIQLADTIG